MKKKEGEVSVKINDTDYPDYGIKNKEDLKEKIKSLFSQIEFLPRNFPEMLTDKQKAELTKYEVYACYYKLVPGEMLTETKRLKTMNALFHLFSQHKEICGFNNLKATFRYPGIIQVYYYPDGYFLSMRLYVEKTA